MDHLLKHLYEEKTHESDTEGILIIEKDINSKKYSGECDIVIVAFINDPLPAQTIKHYEINSKTIEMTFINKNEVSRMLINGNNRRLVDWLLNGTVVFEKEHYITNLRQGILEFPINHRKHKMTVEFSKLIRRYIDGQKLFYNGHFLDAFNSILHSLHHLARLSVIEHGFYPEVTVWKQVKQIEPEIYKLYDEMVMGEESLEKRLELLLIANNFALTSKTKIGATHLLEVMKAAAEPLCIEKLSNHPEVKEYVIDLVVLIDYLVQKGYVDIVKMPVNNEYIYERLYYVK